MLGELGLSAHPWRPWNALAELALVRGEVDEEAEREAHASYRAWREQGGAPVIEPEALRLLQASKARSVVAREARFEDFARALNAAREGHVAPEQLARLAPILRYEVGRRQRKAPP